MSFDSPLPASQQPRSGDVLHSVLRVTTSSGVQVYKVNDVVKLDTKPIIYGRVMHFVKVSKKNDVDKVVVQRQPDEVCKDEKIGVLLNSFFSKPLASMIEPNWAVTLDSLHSPIRNIRLDISCPNERNKGGKDKTWVWRWPVSLIVLCDKRNLYQRWPSETNLVRERFFA